MVMLMAPGIVLVVLWLLVAATALTTAVVLGYRWLQRWLNAPDEPPLPPPDRLGAECVVLKFADQFVDAVPKSEVPEWQRQRYTEVADGRLVLTQPLAEAMLLAALVELWQQGMLQFRVASKNPDPFDPNSLDYEVLVSMGQMLPLTLLGRSFTIGFREATKPIWLLREKRSEAVLEDMVEFALREVRRCLGWRKAKRNSAENLVAYVREFAQAANIPPDAVETVKGAIKALQQQDAVLADAVKNTISYTMTALRRLEPDRDDLGF